MADLNTVKDKLAKLVAEYKEKANILGQNEARTRQYLIDPFWEALGWDMRNPDHVDVESNVQADQLDLTEEEPTGTKRADYTFLHSYNKTAFVVEAKKPKVNLRDEKVINQLKRYGFTLGIDIGILHDFEEFRAFDTAFPVTPRPEVNLIKEFDIGYEQYPDFADKLLETFGREAVLGGSIQKLVGRVRKGKSTIPVDRHFLDMLKDWRKDLAIGLANQNPAYSIQDINEYVGRILNRIIFLRVVEERHALTGKPLEGAWNEYRRYADVGAKIKLYEQLKPFFLEMNEIFNGVLFKPTDWDEMKVPDPPVYDMLREIYNPLVPYDFGVIPVELLGTIYERFLGEVVVREDDEVKIEVKPEVRKAGGVYYTPKYIVDYIVEQTVGKLIEGKTPEQIAKIKILDPACGSGSFLIGAYERLMKYHLEWFKKHPKKIKAGIGRADAYVDGDNNWRLGFHVKQQILVNNIYGVDIDGRAVEVTMLSLYLKLMEDETYLTLEGMKYLPDLKDNIKCGNSLIGWDIQDMDILPTDPDERQAELARINPFDWEREFPEVFYQLNTEQGSMLPCSSVDSITTPCPATPCSSGQLHAYHVTWVTYGSRVSERMVEYKDVIRRRRLNKGQQPLLQPVILDEDAEIQITRFIADIVCEDGLRVLAYNICRDHLHMIIVCNDDDLTGVVQKLKSVSARKYNIARGLTIPASNRLNKGAYSHDEDEPSQHMNKGACSLVQDVDGGEVTRGITQTHLWAQKYNKSFIDSEEKLRNCMEYIENNRTKHDLPVNKGLLPLVQKMVYNTSNMNKGACSLVQSESERDPERAGGFDAVIGNPPYVRQEGLGEQKKYFATRFESYAGSADLYTYFIERALKLLNGDGRFSYIVSNKWMRSNYGKPLRNFLSKFHIEEIIDFGELPVFADAATFPMIMVVNKGACSLDEDEPSQHMNKGACSLVHQESRSRDVAHTTLYAPIKRLDFDSLQMEKERVGYALESSAMSETGFTLVRAETQAILEKIKEAGVPLGDYVEGKIYRGVLTGFNEAFIINKAKRDELIAEDPKSAEIIKPFVVGDDVRKYNINFRDRYLILTKIGVDIERYPAIFKHLSKYQDRLEKRWDKGNHWWELRACAYYDEFEKPKIVWPEIAMASRFAYDTENYYFNKTCFICPYEDLYLLAVLNSKLIWSFLIRICPVLGDPDKGGRLTQQWVHLKQLPIRTIDFSNPDDVAKHDRMVELVESMLALNKRLRETESPSTKKSIEAQIAHTDRTIDKLVYDLYGLTAEEIKIVEDSAK